MPLKLHLKTRPAHGLDVAHLVPNQIRGKAPHTISVYAGNQTLSAADVFEISGSSEEDNTIYFSGDLSNVHGIGSQLNGGWIKVQGNAGPLVGHAMSAGEITIEGNAGDYLGAEMTGGRITVFGNAGNYVGAHRQGSKYGMNRGEIYIGGSAGESVGRRMRRGMIVVAGDVGALCGWEMLAGTIVVFGKAGMQTGLDMKRGTIILAGMRIDSYQPTPFVAKGTLRHCQTIAMIAAWLKSGACQMEDRVIDERLLAPRFLQFHGDLNEGGRGEIFVAQQA